MPLPQRPMLSILHHAFLTPTFFLARQSGNRAECRHFKAHLSSPLESFAGVLKVTHANFTICANVDTNRIAVCA